MKITLAILFLAVAIGRADFADDQYMDHPDVLIRIVAAARDDKLLKSSVKDDVAFYLRRARYIGPLNAPFGTVHVAQLFYIRSAPRGSKLPPRGHTFVVFLDKHFKIRAVWLNDLPDESLYVDGEKLISHNSVVLDYAHISTSATVLYDGKVVGLPQWK